MSERGGDGRSLEGSFEVDDIPFRNTFSRAVWQLETTTQWQKDQKGGGANLQETRLYLYADDRARIVYLITIGNKDTQAGDIALARTFAESLQDSPP